MMGLLQIGSSVMVKKKASVLEGIAHNHRPPFPCAGNKGMLTRCSLRGGRRRPLWRGRVMSSEAIQVVQSLKLAKSSPNKLASVFDNRVVRLIKSDLLAALAELQRQNECELAIMVFDFLHKEGQHRPDLSLYSDMLLMLGKNNLIEMAEELFSELKNEGLRPDTRAYTELIGAFLQVGMVEKAMETYRLMKEEGCEPDKLALTILIRNLEKVGEKELALSVKKECAKYMDFPKKFINKVEREYPKRRPFKFV